jgi:hypothetical protein
VIDEIVGLCWEVLLMMLFVCVVGRKCIIMVHYAAFKEKLSIKKWCTLIEVFPIDTCKVSN